ncbi:pogo transposable [Stemphylium lycopersici]|nr:pogo transposable [Stemphylium lycopersici]
MDPIQEAIEYIESHEPGDDFSYTKVAAHFGVERSTLARRHQGVHNQRGVSQRSLHPEREAELVRYIETLTERRLPPTKVIVQQFASQLAGKPVSETWVKRFLRRHPNHLISRSGKAMAKERTKADSGPKYSLYFKLLHKKIEEYNVQPIHIFNMDEKGFQLGRVGRTNRVFDKKLYESKGPPLIKKSFEATGIYPANPDVVLEKFAKQASDSDSSNSVLSGSDWLKLKSIVRGLRQSLSIKERRPKHSFTLQLDEDEVYHGGAKIWSPRSVQRARDRRASQQQQAELQKLQKAEQVEASKAARECELQLKAARRVEREKGWEETRKRKAEEKAEREHRRSLRDAAKAIQLPQSGKRKGSKPHKPATKRQKGVVGGTASPAACQEILELLTL